MKSRLAPAMPVVWAVALAAALAGCATHKPADQALAAKNTATASQHTCIRDTGSRIRPKEGECLGPGRSYSRDDLDRTGSFDAADALRKLDPAIQ
jgi:hypothetical protein